MTSGFDLRPVEGPEQWAAAPAGRYQAGEHWAHWCLGPELFGVLLWGRPGGPEVQQLVESLKVELGPDVVPHRSIVDARRLEGADAQAFEALGDYVSAHREALAAKVTRLALVRPDGLPGAVTAGFFSTMGAPYPVEVFEDLGSAVKWLDAAPAVAETLEALCVQATETDPFVFRLRALIESDLVDISVAKASAALGVSERSFQRRLKEAGSTFQDELIACRIRAAQKLLLDSDAQITSVALDVGFSSSQHFSRTFFREVGEQPGVWRKKRRP